MNRNIGFFYTTFILAVLLLGTLDFFSIKRYYSRPSYIRAELQKVLGKNFSFEKVSLSLFEGLTLHDFRLYSEKENPLNQQFTKPFFHSSKVQVRFHVSDLVNNQLSPARILIYQPDLTLREREEGTLNIQEFINNLPEREEKDSKQPLPGLSVFDGSIHLKQLSLLLQQNSQLNIDDVSLDIQPIRQGDRIVFIGNGVNQKLGPISVEGRMIDDVLDLELTCEHIRMDRDLIQNFSADLREAWSKYQLQGKATLTYKMTYDMKSEMQNRRLIVEAENMQASFADFPYLLQNVEGTIQFHPERTIFNVRVRQEKLQCTVSGTTEGYGPTSGINVAIQVENMPIDRKLFQALEPDVREFVKSLNPSGSVRGNVNVNRDRGEENVDFGIRIHPQNIQLSYEEFPYPVKNVKGTIFVEPGELHVERLSAVPDLSSPIPEGANIVFNGNMQFPDDSEKENAPDHPPFQFTLTGEKIPFESTMKRNLPEQVKKTWEALDPVGNGNIHWNVKRGPEEKNVSHNVRVALSNSSFHPEEIDSPITNVTGNLSFENETVHLTGISGNWNQGSISIPDGRIRTNNGNSQPVAIFTIQGNGLKVDRELKELLTKEDGLLTAIQNQGTVDFKGQLRWFEDTARKDVEYYISANVHDMKIEKAVDLSEISGNILLKGEQYTLENATRRVLSGGLKDVNMQVYGVPVRSFSANFLARNESLSFYDLSGNIVEGSLQNGKLQYNANSEQFDLNVKTSDLNLRKLLSALQVDEKNLSGKIGGTASLRGTATDKGSWKGKGKLQLRDAQLWKLPIFFSIFGKLSLSRQEPFTQGSVEFEIANKKIEIDEMLFTSPSSRLISSGEIGFGGELKLDLKAEVSSSIPIIGWVYDQITQNLVGFRLTGTIQEPSVSAVPIPILFK